MNTYKRHRFRLGAPTPGRPPDIISYAVWLYYRFNLSHRDVEDLLAERGITNNRAEQSHEATRVRERGMRGAASRRFKSAGQAQRFLGAHAAVQNLFNLGRYLVRAEHYRNLRVSAFEEWGRAAA
jgi:putative transposase